MSASVSRPYTSGSRVPRRFKFGPFKNRIFTVIFALRRSAYYPMTRLTSEYSPSPDFNFEHCTLRFSAPTLNFQTLLCPSRFVSVIRSATPPRSQVGFPLLGERGTAICNDLRPTAEKRRL